jgi:hypothetical protein
VPFLLAIVAGLLGKYPLTDRTAFFLLPCLWLAAACGIKGILEWARPVKWGLTGVAVAFLVLDFSHAIAAVVWPNPGIDFRGAYQFMHDREKPGDLIWSTGSVVYDTYYPHDPAFLGDIKIETALQESDSERLWLFIPPRRPDFERLLIATGRRISIRQLVAYGEVVLLEAKPAATAKAF